MVGAKAIAVGAAMLCSAAVSFAATVPYAPQSDASGTVNYITIVETSPEVNPLFNQPFASGNSLIFDAPNFFADAAGPFGFNNDHTNGQIDLTITAKPGHYIQSIDVHEFGGYVLMQSLLSPGSAFASVTNSSFFARVVEVDGTPVPVVQVDGAINFPDGQKFYLNVPSYTDTAPSEGNWVGTGSLDIASLYGSTQITKITFSFNNILAAEKTEGAYASIFKNGITISAQTVPVPEPTSLALLAGAGMLIVRRRRWN